MQHVKDNTWEECHHISPIFTFGAEVIPRAKLMEDVKTVRLMLVPRAGVEPARPCGQRILSPVIGLCGSLCTSSERVQRITRANVDIVPRNRWSSPALFIKIIRSDNLPLRTSL